MPLRQWTEIQEVPRKLAPICRVPSGRTGISALELHDGRTTRAESEERLRPNATRGQIQHLREHSRTDFRHRRATSRTPSTMLEHMNATMDRVHHLHARMRSIAESAQRSQTAPNLLTTMRDLLARRVRRVVCTGRVIGVR